MVFPVVATYNWIFTHTLKKGELIHQLAGSTCKNSFEAMIVDCDKISHHICILLEFFVSGRKEVMSVYFYKSRTINFATAVKSEEPRRDAIHVLSSKYSWKHDASNLALCKDGLELLVTKFSNLFLY